MTLHRDRPWRQLGLLAILAVLSPGCGGSTSPNAPPLFQDFFNGAFPGTGWTTPVTTGSATATIDSTVGNPLPSLKMTTTAATSDSAKTSTVMTFSNPSVSFTVSMADISTATTQLGVGAITILDQTPST